MFMWRDMKNPTAGGAGRTTHELCTRWAKKGHKVTIFTSAFTGCAHYEKVDGYEVVRKGSLLTHYYHAYKYYKNHCRGQYDVVIDQINTIPYFTPFYTKDARIMVFIHQLCREIWFYEKRFPLSLLGYLAEPLYLRLYKKYPAVTVSESTRNDLLDLGFTNVAISYNAASPIASGQQKPKESDPTVIFVGRLKKAKRPHHVLKAISILKRDIPNIRLWLVGDGDFKKTLTKLTVKYKIEKDVTFLGWLSMADKTDLMQRAHCICVPSVREGWGLIVTEANLLGTPAIVYDVHGLRDSVTPGVNGLVTEENTPRSLATTIQSFFNDKRRMNELSISARQHASTYSWDTSASQSLEFISEVCSR
jgi:glycosyltransferase involved in cell wall biosynthesis